MCHLYTRHGKLRLLDGLDVLQRHGRLEHQRHGLGHDQRPDEAPASRPARPSRRASQVRTASTSPRSPSIPSSTSGSLSGVATGSGSDWINYSYAQTQSFSDGAWSSASGTGGASGGSSAAWGYQLGAPPSSSGGSSGGGGSSYSGSGAYSETAGYYDGGDFVPYGTVNGTLGASGAETFSLGWRTSASMSPGEGWTQAGSGSVAATGTYSYYYAGSGSGVVPVDDYPNMSGATWNISGESGSGGGAYTYNDSFTLQPNGYGGYGWSAGTPSYTGNSTQQDGYNYHSSGSVTYDVSPEYSYTDDYNTTISQNGITYSSIDGWGSTPSVTFGGSGVGTTVWHDNPFSFTYFNVRETDTTTLLWVPDAANDNADVSATYATDSTFDGTPPYGGPSLTTNTVTQNAVVDYWAGVQIPVYDGYSDEGIWAPVRSRAGTWRTAIRRPRFTTS